MVCSHLPGLSLDVLAPVSGPSSETEYSPSSFNSVCCRRGRRVINPAAAGQINKQIQRERERGVERERESREREGVRESERERQRERVGRERGRDGERTQNFTRREVVGEGGVQRERGGGEGEREIAQNFTRRERGEAERRWTEREGGGGDLLLSDSRSIERRMGDR